ncbi:zinc ABC transporter substrate-binding protein [Aestuariirhabdus litorea]|nr:zinc ABC transporter substrate-binding protein [Aestuariirhabdus litorea]
MWRYLPVVFCTLAIGFGSSARAAQEPVVLASIKPLQLLAAAIMEGGDEPGLLVPVGASPHDYSLRPSDLKRVKTAGVLFWVGPALEPYLQKLASQLPAGAIEQHFLEAGEGEASAHGHGHDEAHHHGEADLHLWLDPDQGRRIARTMAAVLATRDSANAERYQRNLERFEARLDAVIERNRLRLSLPAERHLFVFHDAYQGLESFYGVKIEGAVTLSPEMQPGTRHLLQLRQRLQQAGPSCLLTEPQFPSAMVKRLTEGLDIRLGEIDPLAGNVPAGPEGYLQHQLQLVERIADCTRPTTQ